MEARPVALALSRTVTVAVREPLSAVVVDQGREMGPLLVVVVLVMVVPLTLSVTVRSPAAAFSSQTVNHTVPRTVAPLAGAVMNTLIVSVPPPPAGLIVKVWAPEVCPSGLRTLTGTEPAAAMSEAGMLAVTRVALTNVVVRAAPFQSRVAPDTKPLPSAVSVKAGPPTVALFGVSVLSVGATGPPLHATWTTALPPRS